MNGSNEVMGRDGLITAAPVCVATSGHSSAKTRIWMVDDNSSFRNLLANLLNEVPAFDCTRGFSSPAAVLKALSSEAAPDVILLDIEMGEDNGLDAIQPIKEISPQTHVVMLTTFRAPGARERAFREGASDFLLKTLPVPEIVARIRHAMEFGAVTGLVTAYLRSEKPVTKAAAVKKIEVKPGGLEGWMTTVRGLFKLGLPST